VPQFALIREATARLRRQRCVEQPASRRTSLIAAYARDEFAHRRPALRVTIVLTPTTRS
jgi:hypothetical protein